MSDNDTRPLLGSSRRKPGRIPLDGSSSSNLIPIGLGTFALLVAVVGVIFGAVAFGRLDLGFTTPTITVTQQAIVGSLMTNTTMNRILRHNTSGPIPPTHAMQTLESPTIVLPPPTSAFDGLTPGPAGLRVFAGPLILKTSGVWSIFNLTLPTDKSAADAVGQIVLKAGEQQIYCPSNACLNNSLPPFDGTSNTPTAQASVQIYVDVPRQLTLYLRSSSELNFDYCLVRKNGNIIYLATGIGTSDTNGYEEGSITFTANPNDIILVEFDKDGTVYGGYDNMYFYMSYSTPAPKLSMTLPNVNLSAYVGKEIQVCSLDTGAHQIEFQGPAFDGKWQVLQFQANGVDSCCATFSVLKDDRFSITSRDPCSVFCATTDLFHCVDPDRPEQTNKFHGWWKSKTKYDPTSYCFYDMTQVPIVQSCLGGTIVSPQEPKQNTPLIGVGMNILSNAPSTNFHDPDPDSGASLIIYQVGLDLITYSSAQDVNGAGLDSVAERYPNAPANVIPESTGTVSNLSPDDPLSIFRWFVENVIYKSQTYLATDEKFIGFENAMGLYEEIVSVGRTESISIINTSVTSSVHPSGEGLTVFYTPSYHHVAPPSIVTISGYTGACVSLNGDHMVNTAGTNNFPIPNGDYQDLATLHHKVTVFFNSIAIPVYAGTNVANCTGSTPILSVSYGPIRSNTNYIRTVGAIMYWLYEAIKVSLHTRPRIFYDPASQLSNLRWATPRVDWADIKNDLASVITLTGLDFFKTIQSRRGETQSSFYTNPAREILYNYPLTLDRRGYQGFVDMSGISRIRPEFDAVRVRSRDISERGTFWYNVPLSNYLEGAAYPAWKMSGTSRSKIGRAHV